VFGIVLLLIPGEFAGADAPQIVPRTHGSREAELERHPGGRTMDLVLVPRPGDRYRLDREHVSQVLLPPGASIFAVDGLPVIPVLSGNAIGFQKVASYCNRISSGHKQKRGAPWAPPI